MNENEKRIFKELCKFESSTLNDEMVKEVTPAVLGQLFLNRMQGIAYDVLRQKGLLSKVTREFRNSLFAAYEQNRVKNRSFYQCVSMLSDILKNCPCKVAMLKGAVLCAYYPEGYRTANDIDLLVRPEDVTIVGNLLSQSGFRQGNVRNGEFVPATRREIIESKMMRGETVPYVKEVSLPYMRYLEVDINFSLDYKNGDADMLYTFLDRGGVVTANDIRIPSLSKEDFFLHLCAHLYKEATTLPWIEMHRDMTLYKYCDIYLLLSELSVEEVQGLFLRAYALGLEKVCAYAILETMSLFDLDYKLASMLAKQTLEDDPLFCLRVIDPGAKRTLYYATSDATDRFFLPERMLDLKEK